MACKKPVIILKDAIIPEEVKDKCIRVNILEEFLRNPFIKNFAQIGDREKEYHFAKSHNWDKTIASYLALYEEIVAYPKPKGRITKAVDQLTDAGLAEYLENNAKI